MMTYKIQVRTPDKRWKSIPKVRVASDLQAMRFIEEGKPTELASYFVLAYQNGWRVKAVA